MKILQINKYYFQKGGAETVFFNTINLLEKHGHTVIPFCLKNKKNFPTPYEKYFVDYPELSESTLFTKIKNTGNFIYNKEAANQLRRLIEAEKPDIAHIHLLFNSLSLSILPVLKEYNIPVVMSVHDYRLICPAYTFTNGKGEVCEKCLLSHSYWHCTADKCSKGSVVNSLLLSLESYFREYCISPLDYINKFIFVSRFACNKHIEGNSLYKNKNTVLHNFTHMGKNYQETQKEDYFLYIGRISHEKGIDTLIKAFKDLPSLKLKIIGTGPELNRLQAKKSSNIDFLGFKSGTELINHIRNARFVIVPSEWYENNPLSIIEALSLGTPVIGSRIGGIPELVIENVNGFLFESGNPQELTDKVKQATELTEETYTTMCTAAKNFADQNHSEESHYPALLDIYHSVLNQK